MEPTSPSSQGSEDSILLSKDWASRASGRSSGTPPARESSNDTGPTSPDGEMLLPTPRSEGGGTPLDGGGHRPWPKGMTFEEWIVGIGVPTSSAEDSPASPSAPQDGARPRTISAGSGPSTPVSFAIFNPDGSLSRTYRDSSVQVSLLGAHYEKWSGTWPRSGMCRDGIVYELPTWERPIAESGSSFSLPTPTSQTGGDGQREDGFRRLLAPELRRLHTPTATDGSPRYDNRASPGYTRAIPVPNLDAQIAELLPGDHTNPPSDDGSE